MATVNNSTSTSAADVFASLNGNRGATTTSTTQEMQDRFLTLLTTQLKNQDPLNPLDNSQVTSQLAQINTVNGIEKLNTTLGQLLGAYNDSMSMQSASLLGKNVLVPGKSLVAAADGSAVGGANLASDADKVTVSIMDSSGNVIQTENLGAKSAGNFGFSWDGKDANGNQVPAGNYTFAVEATKGGAKVTASTLQVGTVNALVRGKTGFQLDLGESGIVNFSDVQEIL